MISTSVINFRFENKTTREVMNAAVPYFPAKSIEGFYSGLYKKWKAAMRRKGDIDFVSGKKWVTKDRSDRTVIEMNSGIKLNIPFEITHKDVKIINHHLEGVRMSLNS